VNQIIISGNAAAAPELRKTQNGKTVTTVRVAVRDWRGDKDSPLWVGVVCWDKTAEIACDRVTKGTQVIVRGRLQVRTYQDRQGAERTEIEVVADDLEFGSGAVDTRGQQPGTPPAQRGNGRGQQPPADPYGPTPFDDEPPPF